MAAEDALGLTGSSLPSSHGSVATRRCQPSSIGRKGQMIYLISVTRKDPTPPRGGIPDSNRMISRRRGEHRAVRRKSDVMNGAPMIVQYPAFAGRQCPDSQCSTGIGGSQELSAWRECDRFQIGVVAA